MSSNRKAPAPPVTVEDDENLDDLDDVLERFSKRPAQPKPSSNTQPTSSKPQHGPEPPPKVPSASEAEFAAELAAGMESLMKELAGTGFAGTADGEGDDHAVREAFEKMLLTDLEGGHDGFDATFEKFQGSAAATWNPAPGTKTTSSNPFGSSAKPEADFQKTIKEAVDRLRNSDDTLKADAANAADPFSQLLTQLGDMGDLGDIGEGDDVQGLLEGMMSQLMSKELLYEPLKELDDKYPEYFAENSGKLSKEDLDRYKNQHTIVARIVKLFEDPSYSDENPEKAAGVLKLMNEMQALGSPPTEIMGDLPPGFAMGADGMPNLEGAEGCIIS